MNRLWTSHEQVIIMSWTATEHRSPNNSKPTGHLIPLPKTYWWMRLEKVQNRPEYDQNQPKNVKNQANWTKNIQKSISYCKNSTHDKKVWEFPSKSYYWSSNLLGTSCLGSATICSSEVKSKPWKYHEQDKSCHEQLYEQIPNKSMNKS